MDTSLNFGTMTRRLQHFATVLPKYTSHDDTIVLFVKCNL